MDQARWLRMWELFDEIVELPDLERDAHLERVRSEDGLLAGEVEALIATHSRLDQAFLEQAPTLAGDTPGFENERWLGREVGPYRLEYLLGEGGMGVVFAAVQEQPIRRRVALKVVRPGLDSSEVLLRFSSERQALALMDHPNIAHVHDAGSTTDGRPYFVMELVEGPPITQYCDSHQLDLRERISLFLPVCRAIQHAHQKGVVHRDIKPSNVLVAQLSGDRLSAPQLSGEQLGGELLSDEPIPKVIDFGVAKALETRLTESTLQTRHDVLVGTPEYMSPEQAAAGDLDTRADVYSLGVLLFDLLTGTLPFGTSCGRYDPLELRRQVLEDRAPTPSSRVRSLRDDCGELAARRAVPVELWARELRGELDWVVAKTLEKERERRYASASELASDLERYLRGEPVLAGPPSRVYRARKLVQRHRMAAGAATLGLLLLIGFGVLMAAQSARLTRSLTAEEHERATATAVSQFLVELLEEPDPARARGKEVTVREVLDRGAARIGADLGGQPEVQARLLETMGRVYQGLGLFEEAESLYRAALVVHQRELTERDSKLARYHQLLGAVALARGRLDEAAGLAEKARAAYLELPSASSTEVAENLDLLAVIARDRGELGRAEQLHELALQLKSELEPRSVAVAASHNYLGIVRRRLGRYADAALSYEAALAIWREREGDSHPEVLTVMNNLALLRHVQGHHQLAHRLFEDLLPRRRAMLGQAHPEVVLTLANHAKLLSDMGRYPEAEAVYREVLELGRESWGEQHPQRATALAELGRVELAQGRPQAAFELATEALEMRRALLGAHHPSIAASLSLLAAIATAREPGTASAEELWRQAQHEASQHGPGSLHTGEILLALGSWRLDQVSSSLPRSHSPRPWLRSKRVSHPATGGWQSRGAPAANACTSSVGWPRPRSCCWPAKGCWLSPGVERPSAIASD